MGLPALIFFSEARIPVPSFKRRSVVGNQVLDGDRRTATAIAGSGADGSYAATNGENRAANGTSAMVPAVRAGILRPKALLNTPDQPSADKHLPFRRRVLNKSQPTTPHIQSEGL